MRNELEGGDIVYEILGRMSETGMTNHTYVHLCPCMHVRMYACMYMSMDIFISINKFRETRELSTHQTEE